MKPVKIVFHKLYLEDYPTAYVESPDRVHSIYCELIKKGYPFVEPDSATEEDILRVHTKSLMEREQISDVYRYEVALMAAGGAITCARLAMEGNMAFGLIRPPGHHANPDHNWGFCFFNNVAISIEYLLAHDLIKNALLLDIDLHFGDGTDHHFKKNPHVTVSNIQEESRESFLSQVEEALSRHIPYDVIAVSAGFDRYKLDWGHTLEMQDYYTIGSAIRKHADQNCQGRCYAILEGGYHIDDLGKNADKLIQGMSGQ